MIKHTLEHEKSYVEKALMEKELYKFCQSLGEMGTNPVRRYFRRTD